jgi:hypothetical protein
VARAAATATDPVAHDARRWSRNDPGTAAATAEATPPPPPGPPGTPDVDDPAPLLRIGLMVRSVLEETRTLTLDQHARERFRELQDHAVTELARHLGPRLREELRSVLPVVPTDRSPDAVELRIAQAALVGWLEGIFQGAQVAITAQQSAAGAALARMRREALARGTEQPATSEGQYL